MKLYQATRDRQAQPHTAKTPCGGTLGLMELIKNGALILYGNPRPVSLIANVTSCRPTVTVRLTTPCKVNLHALWIRFKRLA